MLVFPTYPSACFSCETVLHNAEIKPGANALMRLWHEQPGLGDIMEILQVYSVLDPVKRNNLGI